MKDSFYERLEKAIENMPKHDMKILCGYFNAKIVKEPNLESTIGQYSLKDLSNVNGWGIIETASSNIMVMKSTIFPHKDIHKR